MTTLNGSTLTTLGFPAVCNCFNESMVPEGSAKQEVVGSRSVVWVPDTILGTPRLRWDQKEKSLKATFVRVEAREGSVQQGSAIGLRPFNSQR